MYKKLRWKILWVSASILLFIIVAVIGTVYRVSSHTIQSQTEYLMEIILENGGSLPGMGDFDPGAKPLLALNEESIYEVRFFVARVSGGETEIVSDYIAISEEDAVSIAESIYEKEKDSGRLTASGRRMLDYMKQQQEDGSTLMVVLDSTTRYGLFEIVMTYMSVVWFAVLIFYIIIMGRYSAKLVRPFEENDERQKRFITNASHELKTPLAVISANTEMTEVVSGKTKWTESTRRQVKKLQTLVEDLVVLSRLDEMKDFALTETDLSELTAETVESFRGIIESSGRQLHVDIEADVQGKAEKRSFQQLVSILMDNSAKYCDENGRVEAALEAKKNGKGLRLTVSNTYAEGKNVDYSRFFERFYREDASHNSAVAGFGIGLSTGKEIAQRLGGRLNVSYQGDTISFEFEQ